MAIEKQDVAGRREARGPGLKVAPDKFLRAASVEVVFVYRDRVLVQDSALVPGLPHRSTRQRPLLTP